MAKAKAKETYTPATTPEDNDYCPQAGQYDPCYSGDLTEFENEFESRDRSVEETRKEFHKGIPAGDGPPLSKGHDLD